MSEKLKKLRKRKYGIIDKRNYLRAKKKSFQLIQHRSTCPVCEQNVKSLVHSEDIKVINIELESTYKELDDIIIVMKPLEEDEHQASEWAKEIMEERVQKFYDKNIYLIKKVNKDYYNGINSYMPIIHNLIERQLWNKSMEKYFDKYNKQENDDLLFKV